MKKKPPSSPAERYAPDRVAAGVFEIIGKIKSPDPLESGVRHVWVRLFFFVAAGRSAPSAGCLDIASAPAEKILYRQSRPFGSAATSVVD